VIVASPTVLAGSHAMLVPDLARPAFELVSIDAVHPRDPGAVACAAPADAINSRPMTANVETAASGAPAPTFTEVPLARRVTPGPALYSYECIPAGSRAVVALLPGFAEHGARYTHVAKAWAERGIATLAIDLRGHGKAEGPRGYCLQFGEFVDDARELVELVRRRLPDTPRFLYGHSFGGLVAASLVLDKPAPWRGLLLTSPSFRIALKVPAVKQLAGRIMSVAVPGFGLPSGLVGADMTHDPARARAYDDDPLIFKNARARWFTETTAAQERALARAGEVKLPLYVTMGTADRVNDLGAARQFVEAAASSDKTFEVRDGLFHEVLNEPEWPGIAARMADWVLAHAS
jgi:alpha-beta hydrolase superfamily lysophospholipase